jgi:hypothetical protein
MRLLGAANHVSVSVDSLTLTRCGTFNLHANNTAGRAATSVASLLALRVVRLAEVVGAGVHDNGAAEHAVRADQLDKLVGGGALGIALAVGLDVAQVTDVAVGVLGGTVLLAVGVDCTSLRPCQPAVLWATQCQREVYCLQWGPAEVQPLVLSPKVWTCMPRSALASWPVMFHEILVGSLSEACSKVTVPLMLESPRRTATAAHR